MLEELKQQTDVANSDGLANIGLEDAWIDLQKVARAAVEAMRTPTEDMIKAGYQGVMDAVEGTVDGFHTEPGAAVWETMIDAILTEKE